MREVVICAGARTPMAEYSGTPGFGLLADLSAIELGAISAKAALERAKVNPRRVDHVIYGNALQNGLLPVRLGAKEMAELFRREVEAKDGYRLTVDLVKEEVRDDAGFLATFSIDEFRREALLQGLDAIGRTLQLEARIAGYEDRRNALLARLEA